jgi:hypothetical protein
LAGAIAAADLLHNSVGSMSCVVRCTALRSQQLHLADQFTATLIACVKFTPLLFMYSGIPGVPPAVSLYR